MSNRLNQERELKLQPIRHKFTCERIRNTGCAIVSTSDCEVVFMFNGNKCKHFPYSGWHQGKGLKAGRGLDKLIAQLKTLKIN